MRDLAREIPVVALALLAYFGVRALTEGGFEQALQNADRVVAVEQRLGLYRETELQDLITGHHWMVTFMNWVYMWGHWPVIAVSALWLFFRRPATYFLLRNAFLISGTIGLVIFVAFPVAPPRLTGIDMADTVTLYSHSYRVLQPPSIVNQYAAMPSLHFGWNLLIGLGLACESRVLAVRVFGLVLPALMACSVVLTANHFVIDAFAGGALALAGLALAWWLRTLVGRASHPPQTLSRWLGAPVSR